MRISSIIVFVLASALVLPVSAAAQGAHLKLDLGNLASRAKGSVNITIDKTTMDWAMQALKSKGGDTEKMRGLMKELEGITVQVLEFEIDKTTPTPEELIGAARSVMQELDGPQWKPVVNVAEKVEQGTELVRVSLWKDAAGEIGGLAILAIEPGEIAFVNVVGKIRLDQLGDLGKALGRPGLLGKMGGGAAAPKPKR